MLTNDQVSKFVCRPSADFTNIAKDLCNEALLLGSLDNVTVLVIDLK